MRRLRRDDRGVSSVELAFIAPGLLLLIFFVVQAALYFYGRSAALQAAREGVSQLRLAQHQSDYAAIRDGVEREVVQFAGSVGSGALNDPAVSSTYDDAAGRVTVDVQGKTVSLIPGLTLTVRERASGSVERFEGP